MTSAQEERLATESEKRFERLKRSEVRRAISAMIFYGEDFEDLSERAKLFHQRHKKRRKHGSGA